MMAQEEARAQDGHRHRRVLLYSGERNLRRRDQRPSAPDRPNRPRRGVATASAPGRILPVLFRPIRCQH
jgi:hypothetical protein